MTNVKVKLATLKGFQNTNDVIIYSVPFSIGRCRTADFIIAHVNVSRNHCKIIKENETWKIWDFSSSGTYVNDALVGKNSTVILNNGDCVRFGPLDSSLCWTFYSFDSSSENYRNLDVKPETPVTLDVCSEKSCSKGKNVFHKINNLDSNLKESVEEVNEETETYSCEDFKEFLCATKEENAVDNSSSEKIQVTKEVQEVKNTLSDLEEKNSVPRSESAPGPKTKTENHEDSKQKNLLENLAELIETEFQCSICSELFVTAITLNCTHTFCKFCIGQWKKKQKNCPICRKKITNETRSLVVDNYIDKVVENLSCELKERRETIIKERNVREPSKKKIKARR